MSGGGTKEKKRKRKLTKSWPREQKPAKPDLKAKDAAIGSGEKTLTLSVQQSRLGKAESPAGLMGRTVTSQRQDLTPCSPQELGKS